MSLHDLHGSSFMLGFFIGNLLVCAPYYIKMLLFPKKKKKVILKEFKKRQIGFNIPKKAEIHAESENEGDYEDE